MGDQSGLPGWPLTVISKRPYKCEAEGDVASETEGSMRSKETFEEATLLALKTVEGDTSQKMQTVPSGSWK